jgi:hypothetical protein
MNACCANNTLRRHRPIVHLPARRNCRNNPRSGFLLTAAALKPRPQKWRGAMASKSPSWLAGLFGAKKKAPPRRATPASTQYHAVSVLPGANACAAAHRFSGQRFLSRQAPRLPLPSCDANTCTCRFRHHKDRRAGPRRNSDVGMVTSPYPGKERRQARGRRAEDRN